MAAYNFQGWKMILKYNATTLQQFAQIQGTIDGNSYGPTYLLL